MAAAALLADFERDAVRGFIRDESGGAQLALDSFLIRTNAAAGGQKFFRAVRMLVP